jgi:hypothetical protein
LCRLKTHLPKYPEEVLKDWFLRHGTNVISNTPYLDHQMLRFELAWWQSAAFLSVTARSLVAHYKPQFRDGVNYTRDPDMVGGYMLMHGTWPVPPSILIVRHPIPGRFVAGERHLLEGHKRLACLQVMCETNEPILLPEHAVWTVRIEE